MPIANQLSIKLTWTSLSLALASLCLACLPLAAQETALPDTFELNARIDERPQLTREDLAPQDNSSMSLSGHANQNMSELLPMPDVTPDTRMPFPLQAETEQPAAQMAMAEYGVDWSAWISRLADLWFFNLKKLTDRSEYEFHITTPTRLEFTCWPNGRITDISIKRSSGVPLYDQLQIEALKHTKSPAFPAGTQKPSKTLVLGWDSHPRKAANEQTYRPGSFDPGVSLEKIKQWIYWR
jgi:hypothetical protein